MRFDDRLQTVLDQPASDRRDRAVRWRQLVDLVARAGPNAASPVVAQALDLIRSESTGVEETLRAAAARAIAALPLPLELLEAFAADRLSVSAPVLAAATLGSEQWSVVLRAADDETRRFVEALHPGLMLAGAGRDSPPLPDDLPEPTAPPASDEPIDGGPPASISDLVERIERLRRLRDQQPGCDNRAPAPPPPATSGPALFRWECSPSGEIAWVEGAARGALIGRSIARAVDGDGDGVDADVLRAFAVRAPFRDAALAVAGDGPISGQWKISGVPAFEPADGRFAGYRGIALREVAPSARSVGPLAALPDPDSLRELVHEIKTPLNAIIGFAEIIDGQFLGPADRRYRQRAMDIVGQAHLLLSAIDDLDFAARLRSRTDRSSDVVSVSELAEQVVDKLRARATERAVAIDLTPSRRALCAVDSDLGLRLLERLCAALIDNAAAGERITLAVETDVRHCRVSLTRPAALAPLDEEALFDPHAESDAGNGNLAIGLSLRLVRGLARLAEGDLAVVPGALLLVLPRA